MKVLVDGDCCNRISTIESIAQKKNIPVLIFCDWTRFLDSDYSEIHTVEKGRDSADFALLKYVEQGDIVVTQDAGLASMALSKKAYVIHNNGSRFTEHNINIFLNKRFLRTKATKKTGRRHYKGIDMNSEKVSLCFGKEFFKLLSYVIKTNKNKKKEGALNE